MKAQILKIAGVKSEKEFYKKFPTEDAFMKIHGEQFRKARFGEQLDGGGFVGESYGVYDPSNPTMVTDNSSNPGYTKAKPKFGEVAEKYAGPVGDLIQGFQKLSGEKEQLASARQWQGVSDVALQASRTREERPQRRYVRPEDTVNTGEELFPIYGVGTNVLAKNGKKVKAKNGFMDAVGDFGDMGGADISKSLISGIGGDNAGGDIGGTIGRTVGSAFGPAGEVIGQIGGQVIGGLIDRNPNKIKKAQGTTRRNVSSMMLNQGVEEMQGQFGSYMKNGGQAMDGDLQVYDGGYAEPVSSNPYLPDGGETVMFRGQSHNDGGINVTYGKNPVEVEGGEPAVKLEDGGGADNLVVFGNLKIPKGMLDDPKAKNKKFKNYIADLSKTEEHQNKTLDTSMEELVNLDVQTSFDKLKLSALKANVLGSNMKLKEVADKKTKAAHLQQAINDTAEEFGLTAEDLAQGKIKKARMGGHFTTTEDGYKSKYGLQPWEGNKTGLGKKTASSFSTEDWDSVADRLGFKGTGNKEFQEFLLKNPESKPLIEARHKELYGRDPFIDSKLGYGWAAGELKGPGKPSPMIPKLETIPLGNKPVQELAPTDPYEPTIKKGSTLMNIYNQALPFLRPSDKENLDPNQLAGEMYAMSNNQLEPVQAQGYHPDLDVPYDISYQDTLNENQADYRASQRMAGYNPAMQAELNAQKYKANERVLGEQFRTNQAEKDKVYSQNRNTLNDAKLKNLAINDQQYTRQSEAKTNTKNIAQAAINSISDKFAKNQLENRTLQTYENLYNYRYDNQGRAINMNPLAQFNTELGQVSSRGDSEVLPVGYEYIYNEKGQPVDIRKSNRVSTSTRSATSRTSKAKSSNGSIVKAIRDL